MQTPEAVPVRSTANEARVLGDETLFFAASGEELHTLNEVGTFVWQSIDGRRSLDEIADLVCGAYEIPREVACRDVWRFAEDLASMGLITLA